MKTAPMNLPIFALMDSMSDYVFVLDRNFIIQKVNMSLLVGLGFERDELVGKRASIILKNYEGFFSKKEDDNFHVKTFLTKINDETTSVNLSHYHVKTEDKDSDLIVCVAKDLLQPILMEKIHLRQQIKMIHTSKMAALGEMSSGIAHEINNPLTIISAASDKIKQLLTKPRTDKTEMYELSHKIEITVQRIASIIRALRKFSRDGTDDPITKEYFDKIINESISFYAQKFKNHGIKVDISIGAKVSETPVECRQVQISQVLVNLINNAFDAVDEIEDKWIKIRVDIVDDQIRFSISNGGDKISNSLQGKIFQPFFTTKKAASGTGLGLSISKGIVEDLNGELFLDTTSVHTRFVIKIPIKQPELRNVRKKNIPQEINVLIVDDVPEVCECISELFIDHEYQVFTASNGIKAMEIIKEKVIHFLITDIRMPEGGGIALIDSVNKMEEDKPKIIVISRYSDLTVEDAYDKGVEAVFGKPLDMQNLIDYVMKTDVFDRHRKDRIRDRYDADFTIEMFPVKEEGMSFFGKIKNIGRGGFYIFMENSFPTSDSTVEFKISFKEKNWQPILGSGIVRWVRTKHRLDSPPGIGLEIIAFKSDSRSEFIKLVNSIKTMAYIPKA